MGLTICLVTCWACKFDEHPRQPHTWMDLEDIEYRGLGQPENDDDWAQLADEQPCHCGCVKGGRNDDVPDTD